MTWTILARKDHGWTDNLGQEPSGSNRWDSAAEAHAALPELASALECDPADLRVVALTDLDSFELLA